MPSEQPRLHKHCPPCTRSGPPRADLGIMLWELRAQAQGPSIKAMIPLSPEDVSSAPWPSTGPLCIPAQIVRNGPGWTSGHRRPESWQGRARKGWGLKQGFAWTLLKGLQNHVARAPVPPRVHVRAHTQAHTYTDTSCDAPAHAHTPPGLGQGGSWGPPLQDPLREHAGAAGHRRLHGAGRHSTPVDIQ